MSILRGRDLALIKERMEQFPIVAILGPRQCGKTTLASQVVCDHFFDLENPRDLARLKNPQTTLENLKGRILIDEIQRKPDLFPLLRYLVDHHSDQKYLILGSASRELLRQSSESLAGRIAYHTLGGFRFEDVKHQGDWKTLWLRGGFPKSFLARTDQESFLWRESYIQTFLERDIPQFGITIPSATLRRFWAMLSHYHGQVVNYSELARSFGVSDMTVRNYIDILASTFMVRLLQPWYVNLSKRQVKAAKLYLRDSGLFHSFQTIETEIQLQSHIKLGASWEGFVIDQLVMEMDIPDERFFFWGIHGNAELDLFWQMGGKNYGVEVKYADAPTLSKSLVTVQKDLNLNHLFVIYPGRQAYPLAENITVVPFEEMRSRILSVHEGVPNALK